MKDSQNQPPKQKWYQKAWGAVKKGASKAWQIMSTNAFAIAATAAGIGLAVPTGGLSLALSIAALSIKAVKVGLDTAKGIERKRFEEESKALGDMAHRLAKKETLLKVMDRDGKIRGALPDPVKKKGEKNLKEAKANSTLHAISGIVEKLNMAADLTSVGLSASTYAQSGELVKIFKEGKVGEIVKGIYEQVVEKGLDLATVAASGIDLANELKEKFADSFKIPEVQKKLTEFINEERKAGHIGYDSLRDLRDQTNILSAQNNALVNTELFKNEGGKVVRNKEFWNELNKNLENSLNEGAVKKPPSPARRFFSALKEAVTWRKKPKEGEKEAGTHTGLTSAYRTDKKGLSSQTFVESLSPKGSKEASVARSKESNEIDKKNTGRRLTFAHARDLEKALELHRPGSNAGKEVPISLQKSLEESKNKNKGQIR